MSMIHILHLVNDFSAVTRLIGACDGMRGFDNAYILLRPSSNLTDECVRANGKLKIVVPGSAEYLALLRCPADVIWVHGAYTMTIRFVLAYKGDAKIVWSALGSDYAEYIGRIGKRTGLKLRIASLFVKMHCFWMLPSEHVKFFRKVDFLSIRDKRDRPAVSRLLSSIVRLLPFIDDASRVSEHETAFIARTIDPWAGTKALGGTGTIRFDANGGVGSMPEVYCENDAVPHLPANAFSRKNFIFSGWALSQNGPVTWGDRAFATGMPFVNGTAKLYARWGKSRCTVRFHANGGGGKMPAFVFTHGVPTRLPNNAFVRTGFCFKGWAHTADGKVIWGDRSPISEPVVKNGAADLFAVWSNELPQGMTLPAGFYGIRFHGNDGTERSVVYCFKYKSVSRLPRLSDLGWAVPKCGFLGWSLSCVGGEIAYQDGGAAFAATTPGRILDMYAIRRAADGSSTRQVVNVKFDANGGNGKMLPLTIAAWTPTKLPECPFTKKFTGYAVGGWALSPNGKMVWKAVDEVCLPPTKNGEITLYAVWQKSKCLVRFDPNGGTGEMETVEFQFDTLFKLPANVFTKRNCEFAGWSWTPSGDVAWPDGGYIRQPPVRNNEVVLYARWICPSRNKLRILHLFSDWWMCTRSADFFANQDPDSYFVLPRAFEERGQNFEVLKNEHDIHEVSYFTHEYRSLIRPDRWDVVWLHGAWLEKCRFAMAVKKADPHVKIMWSTWGFDYLRYGCQWLFEFRSTFLYFRITNWRIILKKSFMWLAYALRVLKFIPHDFVRFLRDVDYFSVTVPTEECFLRRLVNKKAKCLGFHFISEKREITDYRLVSLDSKNVLIGNCARPICNHMDVFNLLKAEKDYDYWTPLSYGYEGTGPGVYGRLIARYGSRKIGDRFHPMLEMMSLEEYLGIIRSCSVFIFGHRRVSALGNVQMAVKRGGCVFLNPANPLYKHLLRLA